MVGQLSCVILCLNNLARSNSPWHTSRIIFCPFGHPRDDSPIILTGRRFAVNGVDAVLACGNEVLLADATELTIITGLPTVEVPT